MYKALLMHDLVYLHDYVIIYLHEKYIPKYRNPLNAS